MPNKLALYSHTFNKISCVLIEQLTLTLGNDSTLSLFRDKVLEMDKNPHKWHVPGRNFYNEMIESISSETVELPSNVTDNSIGGFIARKDEVLFSDKCKDCVKILSKMKLPEKWKHLSGDNRKIVWGYLNRLCTLSAQVTSALVIVENKPLVTGLIKSSVKKGAVPDIAELQRKINISI